jgi:hypothetical protein
LRGTVRAPNGSLARDEAGGAPVADVNVFLCAVSDAGVVASKPMASAKTDKNGEFRLNAPPGTQLSAKLLVQATAGTTCAPVVTDGPARQASANNLSCPAVQPTLPIDPGAEVATRSIFRNVTAQKGGMGNFSTGEVSNLIAFAQGQQSGFTGSSLSEVLQNLDTKLGPVLDAAVTTLADPGESPPPAVLDGVFHLHAIFLTNQQDQLLRATARGSLTLDGGAKTFAVQNDEQQHGLSTPCGTTIAACAPALAPTVLQRTDQSSGTFNAAGNGQVYLTTADSSILGLVDSSGTILTLPFLSANGQLGLGVAVKQSTAAPALTETYASYQFGSKLLDSPGGVLNSLLQTWLNPRTLTFAGAQMSVDGGAEDRMSLLFSGCNACAGVTLASPIGPVHDGFSTGFALSPAGDLSAQGANGAITGFVSADAQLAVIAPGSDAGDAQLLLAVKKSAVAPSITGRYAFALTGDRLGTDGSYTTSLITGTLSIGAEADVSYSQTDVRRQEGCNNGCASVSSRSQSGSAHGTYTLSADGNIALFFNGGGSGFSMEGTFAPDGSVGAITHRLDGAADADHTASERMIGIALRL